MHSLAMSRDTQAGRRAWCLRVAAGCRARSQSRWTRSTTCATILRRSASSLWRTQAQPMSVIE